MLVIIFGVEICFHFEVLLLVTIGRLSSATSFHCAQNDGVEFLFNGHIFLAFFLYWRVTWSIFLRNRCSQISIFLCNGFYRVDDWNENILEADLTCLICDNPCSGSLILSECSLKLAWRFVDLFCMKSRFHYTVLVVLEFPWPQGSLVLSTAQNGSWIIVC